VYHRTVLKKPVLLRARKRSYRGRDVKLISLRYRGREGFAVITGCSVNTRIKCARCNADRQEENVAAQLSLHPFLETCVVTSPHRSLFCLSSFSRPRSFFSIPDEPPKCCVCKNELSLEATRALARNERGGF